MDRRWTIPDVRGAGAGGGGTGITHRRRWDRDNTQEEVGQEEQE